MIHSRQREFSQIDHQNQIKMRNKIALLIVLLLSLGFCANAQVTVKTALQPIVIDCGNGVRCDYLKYDGIETYQLMRYIDDEGSGERRVLRVVYLQEEGSDIFCAVKAVTTFTCRLPENIMDLDVDHCAFNQHDFMEQNLDDYFNFPKVKQVVADYQDTKSN